MQSHRRYRSEDLGQMVHYPMLTPGRVTNFPDATKVGFRLKEFFDPGPVMWG